MKKMLILGMILASVKLCSMPIIFLNGNKAEGIDTIGFLTWNDTLKNFESDPIYYSSMHQVSGYKDYGLSPILDCNKYTELPSGLSDKTMFNFSYYDTASIRGVISMSAESVLVYFMERVQGTVLVNLKIFK